MAFDMSALSQGGLVIGIVFVTFLLVAVIGVGIWWFYRSSQFKISVIIHKVNDGGEVIREIYDKAKHISSKGRNLLQLKKLKEIVNNPSPDFNVPTNKGHVLYFRWDGGHAFQPQKLAYNSPLAFVPGTYNMLQQMTIRQTEANKRYLKKGFWAEYGHIVAWMIFILLTSITLWILFSKLEILGSSLDRHANALLEYTQAVKQVIQ